MSQVFPVMSPYISLFYPNVTCGLLLTSFLVFMSPAIAVFVNKVFERTSTSPPFWNPPVHPDRILDLKYSDLCATSPGFVFLPVFESFCFLVLLPRQWTSAAALVRARRSRGNSAAVCGSSSRCLRGSATIRGHLKPRTIRAHVSPLVSLLAPPSSSSSPLVLPNPSDLVREPATMPTTREPAVDGVSAEWSSAPAPRRRWS